MYGALGADYIEAHHALPLHAAGPRETRLEGLALLLCQLPSHVPQEPFGHIVAHP